MAVRFDTLKAATRLREKGRLGGAIGAGSRRSRGGVPCGAERYGIRTVSGTCDE